MERSAVQRFAGTTIVPVTAAALLLLALSPTWLRAHGDRIPALVIFTFFSKLCHQRPDRVLYLFGAPTAVCFRCLGIYAGPVIGGLIRLKPDIAVRGLGVALILNVLDVAAETTGLHGNLPLLRLLIGATLGIAAGAILSAAPKIGSPVRIPELQ